MTNLNATLPRRIGARRVTLLSLLRTAMDVRRQRHQLAQLDARALADIGVSPEEARAEAGRPAWDMPKNRQK